jgi:hypothetical protein
VTVVETPPRPQPSQDELEALNEEARRRARRRRLAYLAAAVALVVAAGAAGAIVVLTRDAGSGTAVPEGFRVVRARGPVQHALLETLPSGYTTLDLATGRAHPTRGTQEIWWDPRLGIAREDYRQDGRLLGSFPRQNCFGTGPKRFCVPESPFDLRQKGLGWPPRAGSARRMGEETFRGHRVVWIEGLDRMEDGRRQLSGDQVAYDTLTHEPVALRTIIRDGRFKGRVVGVTALTMLPDLPAKDVSFVVPKQGVWRNPPSPATTITGQRLPAARKALGTTPLWLGRSFRGHRLESVVVGIESEQAPTMGLLRPTRFARFGYGAFAVQEFGHDRPFWREEEPAEGSVVFGAGQAVLVRDGVLVSVTPTGPTFRIDRAAALALAKALRPVPG